MPLQLRIVLIHLRGRGMRVVVAEQPEQGRGDLCGVVDRRDRAGRRQFLLGRDHPPAPQVGDRVEARRPGGGQQGVTPPEQVPMMPALPVLDGGAFSQSSAAAQSATTLSSRTPPCDRTRAATSFGRAVAVRSG